MVSVLCTEEAIIKTCDVDLGFIPHEIPCSTSHVKFSMENSMGFRVEYFMEFP